jgi:biopolymer transport protein ExbD
LNLRPHRPEAPDINLTPLVDVVFLLLIFFMVSTTFRDDGRLRLQLPEADAEPVPADAIELVEVLIDRSGGFYIDAEPVASTEVTALQQALRAAVGSQRDLPVLIKADAQAQHQAVMTVLDAAAQLGLTRIAFAATQSAQTSDPLGSGRAEADRAEPAP